MKTVKTTELVLVLFIFILVSIIPVFAITGSIGNGRMVLNGTVGDEIEKSILIKNINDVDVRINLDVANGSEQDIELRDREFTLSAGEEQKAYFIVKVNRENMTENKINIRFTPIGEKNGVGLTSTIIVFGKKGTSNLNISNIDFKIIAAITITILVLVALIVLWIFSEKRKKGINKEENIKYKKRASKE